MSLFAGVKSSRDIKVVVGAANFGIKMKITSDHDMRAEEGEYERLLEEDSLLCDEHCSASSSRAWTEPRGSSSALGQRS